MQVQRLSNVQFEHIFFREKITATVVEGDSFHGVTRTEFKQRSAVEPNFSHFYSEANDFHALEALFKSYGETGGGNKRYYLHNDEEAVHHVKLADKGVTCTAGSGEFTPVEETDPNTDILFYEGLHGLVQDTTPDQKYGGL